MRIAVPTADGKLAMHFGHCEAFCMVDIDTDKKEIVAQETAPAPPHQPGLLPAWLAEQGTTTIIAGGMGRRAQQLFTEKGISVVVGAPSKSPEAVVRDFLEGALETGANLCDH